MFGAEIHPLPPVANENVAPRGAGEARSFAVTAPPETAARPPAVAEGMALAMLRSGRSFMEAAESSGVPVERVMALWAAQDRPRREP
jgi:hypothetical protein